MTNTLNTVSNVPDPSKKLEVKLPRFSFSHSDNGISFGAVNDHCGGSSQQFASGLSNDLRHISLAELDLLFETRDTYQNWVLAQIMLAYLLERGIDLEDSGWRKGLWVCDGIKREENMVAIYKKIDGRIETEYENTFDTTVGHKLKKGQTPFWSYFDFTRTFEKYGEIDLSLKKINKYNPEFVEYLFNGREFEELSSLMQKAIFLLPPNLNNPKKENPYELEIWTMAVDFSFKFSSPTSLAKNQTNQTISNLICSKVSIFPDQTACGVHVIVKD